MEQRYRAVLEVLEGASVTDVAKRYGVARQTVHLGEAIEAWNGFLDGHDAFDFMLDGDGTGTRPRSSAQ